MAAERKLGLTLSGGGFRATLFHLGVVRLLHDAKLLPQVKRIGAVSGGSILAAHLVLNWERYTGDEGAFHSVAQEIIRFVQLDVRGRVVRRWLLAWLPLALPRLFIPKRWTFANLLQRQYARLYRDRTLSDLRAVAGVDRPQVFFYCTSLSTGAVCSFGRSGFMWDEENAERHVVAPNTPVAYAVAASSAFPPLFPPVAISNETLACDKKDFPNPHYLSDGGVYDNLGIDRLMWYHRQKQDLDVFVISDAEGKFDWDFDARYRMPITRNVRASDVLMKRVSTLQFQSLSLSEEQVAIVDIAAQIFRPDDPSVLDPEIQRSLRNVRTDLDSFTPYEISCLIQHGYAVAGDVLASKGLLPEPAPVYVWQPGSNAAPAEQDRIRIIRKSKVRKLRIWSLQDWATWASLTVVGLLCLGIVAPEYLRRERLSQELVDARNRTAELNSFNLKLNAVALDYFKKVHRPVEPGTSVGYGGAAPFAGAGTICCIVKLKSGAPGRYLLSANHIIAPPGYVIGDVVVQPGPIDGGRPASDSVARLFKVLEARRDTLNGPLGGIAEILPSVQATNVISGLGKIQGVEENVRIGQSVFIVGRTTGIGKATVNALGGMHTIFYDSGTIRVGGLMTLRSEIGTPIRGGDSGAPVLTEDGNLAGIVFAGSPEFALAIPARSLFDALGVELY